MPPATPLLGPVERTYATIILGFRFSTSIFSSGLSLLVYVLAWVCSRARDGVFRTSKLSLVHVPEFGVLSPVWSAVRRLCGAGVKTEAPRQVRSCT